MNFRNRFRLGTAVLTGKRLLVAGLAATATASVLGLQPASASVPGPGAGVGDTTLICNASSHQISLSSTITTQNPYRSAEGLVAGQYVFLEIDVYVWNGQAWSANPYTPIYTGQWTSSYGRADFTWSANPAPPGYYWFAATYSWKQVDGSWISKSEHVMAWQVVSYGSNKPMDWCATTPVA